MYKAITTRDLIENPWIRLVYKNPKTGEKEEKEFNLQKFIQRYSSLFENYMHHGKYSVIGKFADRLIWTFQIKTACTDGIRLFVNPLFVYNLEKLRETTVMDDIEKLTKAGKNWKDPEVFESKFEVAKYFYFIIMHECYHMIYRHVEQAKRKPETANGGEYIHWLANTSMDIEINRDIEKQWKEFEGTTTAIDGWFKPEYGNKVWTVIFDERFAAKEEMPDNSEPVIPIQHLNPPGGDDGGQDGPEGEKREYQASQDYVDGWTKALKDYASKQLDPNNFNPLPVDRSKFSHKVLEGYYVDMAQASGGAPTQSGVNQDEWNQGYNDAVIAIINAMNAKGGRGGGDVDITNLPPPPTFGGGDNSDDNNSKQQNSPGAANTPQEIDKMSGQQASDSAQQSANNAQQAANQAQQAANQAQQKANQSGSSADQQAADKAQQAAARAQQAADAAKQAANDAKNASGQGDGDAAKQKAKEAANAANEAQAAANEAKQQSGQGGNGGKQKKPITNSKDLGDDKSGYGQSQGQNGQQQQGQNGQQQGQNGQQQQGQSGSQSGQNGQKQGQNSQQQQGQNGQNGQYTDGVPTYEVTGGHDWKDQGSDLISTEDGCNIMEGEGEDVSREINKTPEEHIKEKMAKLGSKLAEVGKNAGKGYTMGERLAEIAKNLAAPKIKWRSLILRHFENLGVKPQEEYKRKISRSEEYRDDWSVPVVPYNIDEVARNSADIFYLVDASGSISDSDLQIVFRELIGLEVKEDLDIRKSAFVYFSDNFDESRIRVWYKDTDEKEKMRMVKYVSGKDAYGGTDISGSILHAINLKKSKNREMRDLYSDTDPQTLIICFTDGVEGGSYSSIGKLPGSIRDKIVFIILNTEHEGWGFNSVIPRITEEAKVSKKNIVCIDTQKDLVR